MRTAIVLLTRDLRLRDQPALAQAADEAEQVIPLFVFDPIILSAFGAPNRVAFLLDTLHDLQRSLRRRGGSLFVRRGDVVEETMTIARATRAAAVFISADVSAYAQERQRRLQRACDAQGLRLGVLPGLTVVPPDALAPAGGDHYRVFTPYWRQWQAAPRRRVRRPPRHLTCPATLSRGELPALGALTKRPPSPDLPAGGETAGRRQLQRWLARGLGPYDRLHDALADDATSRLSAYLHFGCLSPLEVVERALRRDGAEPFVRQLCWRDFYAQLLAANRGTPRQDYRPRGDRWRDDPEALAAWKEGRTGYPVIDAGMRQLTREGFMHNRARLLTASFLTKDLRIDWRLGAAHFFDWLVDGDVASNVGNWQWVAGTGVDTRPNRIFNPTLQAKRFDPRGDYVRRYVDELADVDPRAIHEPWTLGACRPRGYPEPIIDHADAAARFRKQRG